MIYSNPKVMSDKKRRCEGENEIKYKYIFFDLDGTLTDPKEGITNCVKYALEYYGIHDTNEQKLMLFIGPPLVDSFREFYGFSEGQSLEAVEKYRERFSNIGIFENKVYDGVFEMLQRLTDSGCILVLATSKPKIFADRIMAKYGLRPYFKLVCGSELDGTCNAKDEVIEYAIARLECDREQIIMVGGQETGHYRCKKVQYSLLRCAFWICGAV